MKITKPKICKSYEEAIDGCPKGYYLPKLWELIKLQEEKGDFDNIEKGKWISFWTSTLYKNIGARRLGRDVDGGWDASWVSLANSDDNGRVVYFKKARKAKR